MNSNFLSCQDVYFVKLSQVARQKHFNAFCIRRFFHEEVFEGVLRRRISKESTKMPLDVRERKNQ